MVKVTQVLTLSTCASCWKVVQWVPLAQFADGRDQNRHHRPVPIFYLCVPYSGPVAVCAVCGAWWWCALEWSGMSWRWSKSLLENPSQGCYMLVCYSGVQVDLLYQHKSCSSSQYSLASNCSFRTAGDETLLICLTACQTMLWMAVIPKAPWLQTAGLSLALEVLSVTCAWAAHLCCSADSIAHADLEQSSHQYCLFAARPISLMLMSRHRLCTVVLDCFLAHAVVPVVYLRGCQTIVVLCDAFLSLISMGWWFSVHCLWLIHIMHCPGMDWWCQRGVLWGQGKGDIAGQTM